jgi:phosphotransferase system IIA component
MFMVSISKNKDEQILVGTGTEVIELTGAELAKFKAERTQMQKEHALLETEYKAKRDARESAITKLGEIAGLTKEELDAIL